MIRNTISISEKFGTPNCEGSKVNKGIKNVNNKMPHSNLIIQTINGIKRKGIVI